MKSTDPITAPPDSHNRSWLRIMPFVLATFLLFLAAGLAFWYGPHSSVTPDSSVVRSASTSAVTAATGAQLEERYGVQLTLVALTAHGGLVDVRFRVTNPAKAGFLLDAERMPTLVVEKNSQLLLMGGALDQDALVQNQVYFLLYPNGGNAVQQGDQVSIVIGDLELEHQVVQ